jgi:hypothetical protein
VRLLRAADIRPHDVGEYDVFIPLRGVLQAIESAAEATATPNFGRRLADPRVPALVRLWAGRVPQAATATGPATGEGHRVAHRPIACSKSFNAVAR